MRNVQKNVIFLPIFDWNEDFLPDFRLKWDFPLDIRLKWRFSLDIRLNENFLPFNGDKKNGGIPRVCQVLLQKSMDFTVFPSIYRVI